MNGLGAPHLRIRAIITWFGLASFYLMLAGQATGSECLLAVLVASAGAGYAALAPAAESRRLAWAVPWPRVLGKPLLMVAPDAARVGWVLLKALRRRPFPGVEQTSMQSFRAGADNPMDAARRGLVMLGISFAPNTYAIGTVASGDLLVHRLAPVAANTDRDWPL